MYLRRDERTWIVRAPAKLNVYLDVLGRRTDGFHEIETFLIPVRLWDSIALRSTPAASDSRPGPISLRVRSYWPSSVRPSPEAPPGGDDNLIVRALRLLRERSGCTAGVHVELVKRIPMAAGLGGGSSDAAAALRWANNAWRLGWNRQRLLSLGAEIGSDVPFFLLGGAAICRGRGEDVEPVSGIRPMHFVIAKPWLGLATGAVYQALDSVAAASDSAPHDRRRLNQLVSTLRASRYGDLERLMVNRLEAAAERLLPWIIQIRRIFLQLGCLAHQLSGSGSSYFGICRSAQHARRLAAVLKSNQLGFIYVTRSCH